MKTISILRLLLFLFLYLSFSNILTAQHIKNNKYQKFQERDINKVLSVNAQEWSDDFTVPGIVEGPVYTMTSDGENLYLGGQFSVAGGEAANNVVMWNGQQWSSIGEGIENGVSGTVQGLAFVDGKLFVGGSFLNAGTKEVNSIAYWDGSSWNSLGEDSTNGVRNILAGFGGDTIVSAGAVYSMTVYNNYIVFGGFFNRIGTDTTNGIGAWNYTTGEWESFNGGLSNFYPDDPPYAYAFAVHGNDLYAGGKFENAGLVPARGLAKWNGSAWSEVGGGVNNWTRDMEFDSNGNLYIAGMFDTAGNTRASGVAKWNGVSWEPLGNGIIPYGAEIPDVRGLAIIDDEVFVAGYFHTAGSTTVSSIAKWNGSSWETLGAGLGYGANNFLGTVTSLHAINDKIYAAGNFTKADNNIFLTNTAVWDNTAGNWSKLSDGTLEKGIFDGVVYAVAFSGEDIYAGGNFAIAGGVLAKGIAKLTSTGWEPLGSGVNGAVYSIYVDGNDVYAGGLFGMAGNDTAYSIAKWNGSEWSSVGIGVGGVPDASVSALKIIGGYLYAGGNFAVVGDSVNYALPANSIARFNLTTHLWESLGQGLELFTDFPGYVRAIDGDENRIYAGGQFLLAGGQNANNIAYWENNSWNTLGAPGSDGVEGIVETIKKVDSIVYIGGDFIRSGTGNTTSLVKWDGTNWEEVNGGVYTSAPFSNPLVSKIEYENNRLYIAGYFDKAGTVDVSNIAIWDGGWQNPGGTNNSIYDLTSSGGTLFIGGAFTIAGGMPSVSVGSYNMFTSVENNDNTVPDNFVLKQNYPNPFNPSTKIVYGVPSEGRIQIIIYNLLGQKVKTIVDEIKQPGMYEAIFNGNELSSGVYIYQMQSEGKIISSKKLMLLK